jgi:WD40 repeat protein
MGRPTMPSKLTARARRPLGATLLLVGSCLLISPATADEATPSALKVKAALPVPKAKDECNVPTALAFSPDGRTLAVGVGSRVILYEVSTGQVRATLRPHGGMVSSISFAPDGRAAATTSESGQGAKVWDLRGGKATAVLPVQKDSWARGAVLLPDGKRLASADVDGGLGVWDVAVGKQLAAFSVPKIRFLYRMACSPDGKLLAAGARNFQEHCGEVTVWDLDAGRLRFALRGLDDAVTAVAFSPDGKLLAAGGYSPEVQVVDVGTGKVRSSLRTGADACALAFSPDGAVLAVGGWEVDLGNPTLKAGRLQLWDVAAGKRVLTLRDPTAVNCLAFSPDGTLLAVPHGNTIIRLYEVPPGGWRSARTPNKS